MRSCSRERRNSSRIFQRRNKEKGEKVLKNTKLSCLNPTAHGLFQQKIIDFNA